MKVEMQELLYLCAKRLIGRPVIVRYHERPWHKTVKAQASKYAGIHHIDLAVDPAKHPFGLSWFLHEVAHCKLDHPADSDFPIQGPTAWQAYPYKPNQEHEKAASELASHWFWEGYNMAKSRHATPILKALIEHYS